MQRSRAVQQRWCRPIVTLAALAALAGCGVAWAQPPDTRNWTCERCPFRTGYAASYSAGVSYVSDDAAYFGDATGYDEQGGYLELDAEGLYINEGYRVDWTIEDLGLDARRLELKAGRPGTYDVYGRLGALPRRQFDTTRTVFAARGGDKLTLPPTWARAGLTSGFTALEVSLVDQAIGSDRETIEIGGGYVATDHVDLFVDYRQINRDGVEIQGGAYFTNASLLPRPFDYKTQELDAGLRYSGERSTLELSYYGSFFEDRALALRWDNPFVSVAGGEVGALARPPDSSFQQLSVSGQYRTGAYETVVSYSAAAGLMEQDDALLDVTTNPNLAAVPLPRFALDGQVDTAHFALTATSKPHRRLRVKAAYRYDDRDNQTPIESWSRVIVDSFNSSALEANVPYSFERRRLNLRGDFELRDDVRLSAGYDYAELDRDYQEVAEQDEASGWGQVSWRPNAFVDLRARAGTSSREVDRYDTGAAVGLGQNPLLRKYHLAYRYREFAEITVAGSLPERPISLSGSVRVADDSYSQSRLGLLASDDMRFAADLTWSVSARSSLYATIAVDEIESSQAGSELFGEPDWRASHADEFVTFGGGYRVAGLAERFDLEIDYAHGDGTSEIDLVATSGGISRFPDLESELDSLRVRLSYRSSERLDGSLELRYERFSAEDWALQGVGPATIPTLLTLGASPYDYDLFFISLGLRYSL